MFVIEGNIKYVKIIDGGRSKDLRQNVTDRHLRCKTYIEDLLLLRCNYKISIITITEQNY